MSAIDHEAITEHTLVGREPQDVAQQLLDFVASNHEEGVISADQLKAISALVGANAVAKTLLENSNAGEADISFDDELRISEVQLRRGLGHTALHQVAPDVQPQQSVEATSRQTVPPPTTHHQPEAEPRQEEALDPQSSIIKPSSHNTSPSEQPQGALDLAGVAANVAIERFLRTQPNGYLGKGSMRSAGTNLGQELAKYGHSQAAINQAVKILRERGVLETDKPTEAAKIITGIRLIDTSNLVSQSHTPPRLGSSVTPSANWTQTTIKAEVRRSSAASSEFDNKQFDTFVSQFAGKAVRGYLGALKQASGEVRVDDPQSVLIDRIRDIANASIPEGDSQLSERDILKAQSALSELGVVELVKDDLSKPNRLTAVLFSADALAQIVKKNEF